MTKAFRHYLLWVVLAGWCSCLLVIMAIILWRGIAGLLLEIGGVDRRLHRSFLALKVGMPKSEVMNIMGSLPIWTNMEFTLGQYQGNEREYAKTNGIDAKVFYTWVNGDLFYCVGFGGDDCLVVKGKGGT